MKTLLKLKGILLTYTLLIILLVINSYNLINTYKIGEEAFAGCDSIIINDEESYEIYPENNTRLAKIRLYEQYRYEDNVRFKNEKKYNLTIVDYYKYTFSNIDYQYNNVSYDLIDTSFNYEFCTNDNILIPIINTGFIILMICALLICIKKKEDNKLTQIENLSLKLCKIWTILILLSIVWNISINCIILFIINNYYGFTNSFVYLIVILCILIGLTLNIVKFYKEDKKKGGK